MVRAAEVSWSLNRLPGADKFSKAYLKIFVEMIADYDKLSDYQRTLLTEDEQKKYDALKAAYGEDGSELREAFRGRVKFEIAEGKEHSDKYVFGAYREFSYHADAQMRDDDYWENGVYRPKRIVVLDPKYDEEEFVFRKQSGK